MSVFADTLVAQFAFVQWATAKNLDGMTHADTIVRPKDGGNDFNWVFGHMVAVRNALLPSLGAEPIADARLRDYVRESTEDTSARIPLDELRAAFDATHERLTAAILRADDETLGKKAPFSPGGDPNETVGTLLRKSVVHESYHAGQLGLLRHSAGKPGAIRIAART